MCIRDSDKGAADIGHFLQVLDGVVLEVDLRRNLEPLHVYSPLRQTFFVDEVDSRHVGSGGVASEGTAAQGQGRGIGVVDVTDSALRGRGVDDNTADLHGLAVLLAQLVVVTVDNRRVAQAAELQHLLCSLEAFLFSLDDEIGQDRGEFFSGDVYKRQVRKGGLFS